MKTLYLTDLDGTFLDNNARVSPRSAKIINDLTARGLLFSLATARTYATVIPLFKSVDLRLPLVLMNGVCIYDPVEKKTLSVHPIKPEVGKEIASIFESRGKNPLMYFEQNSTLTVCYKNLDNDFIKDYIKSREAFFNKKFRRVNSFDFESGGSFVYIVTLDKPEAIRDIYLEMKKNRDIDCNFYNDNYTDCYFLEAMSAETNKGSGTLELKKLLGVDRIVAFGDNMNDLPLFLAADECYATANACEELKKAATGIIGSNDEDAVAKFIQKDFLRQENFDHE